MLRTVPVGPPYASWPTQRGSFQHEAGNDSYFSSFFSSFLPFFTPSPTFF